PDNPAGVNASLAIRIRKVASVAHEPARDGKLTHRIDRRNRMARRQCDDVIAPLHEERIDAEKERNAALSSHGHERCLHLSFATGPQGHELHPKHTGRRVSTDRLALLPPLPFPFPPSRPLTPTELCELRSRPLVSHCHTRLWGNGPRG